MKNPRLNDNEVKEVARMQNLITKYEMFIQSLFCVAKNNANINYLKFAESDLDKEISYLWKWVKERKQMEQ